MTALATTMGGDGRCLSTAIGSRSAAINHAQTWTDTEQGAMLLALGMCQSALGHVVQGPVRVDQADGASVPSKSSDLHRLLLTSRGFGLGAFSHSRSARVVPLRLSRKRVCLVPPGHTRAYSVRFSACQPSALNTCRHQRLVNCSADRLHRSIPSLIASSVKTPWTEGMPTSCQSLPKWSVK